MKAFHINGNLFVRKYGEGMSERGKEGETDRRRSADLPFFPGFEDPNTYRNQEVWRGEDVPSH